MAKKNNTGGGSSVSDAPAREANLRSYTQAEYKADLKKTIEQQGLYDFVADCIAEIASLTIQLPLRQYTYIQNMLIKIRESVAQAVADADNRTRVDARELQEMISSYGDKIFKWSRDLGYLDHMYIGELLTSIELAIKIGLQNAHETKNG